MRNTLVALLLSCVALHVSAKCVDQRYSVSGEVVDSLGKPVAGALIGISWTERGAARSPVVSTSDADGRFQLTFGFNTLVSYSSADGHNCRGELRSISVTVQPPESDPMRFSRCIDAPGPVELGRLVVGEFYFEPLDPPRCGG